jgi:hypothetical protein
VLRRVAARELRLAPVRVLLGVLVAGSALRLALMLQWRPGFIGYPDSGAYLAAAFDPGTFPFLDPLRVAGYVVFVRGLHEISADLSLVTLVQHGLGVLSALGLYALVRALGVRSRWVAVVPAAVVALGGSQVMFEHAVLSESLWLFLVVAALLLVALAVRPLPRPWLGPALVLAGGIVLGVSVTVRLPGLVVAPVLAVWLAFAVSGSRGRRALIVGVLAVGVTVPVLAFAAWHDSRTDRFGLSRNGAMNFYGRVAPWADCSRFTPPRGTAYLCEDIPVRERLGHEAYIFAASPATSRFDIGGLSSVLPAEGSAQIQSWSRAAVLGQPFTYLHAVLRESRRLIDPDAEPGLPGQTRGGFGSGPESYLPLLTSTERDINVMPIIAANYPGLTELKRGDISWFETYEETVRAHPVLMALMLALTLMGPVVTRGPERRAALLLAATVVLLLEVPVATSMYDHRYVAPVLGLLAASAAIGGWGVATATRRAIRAP